MLENGFFEEVQQAFGFVGGQVVVPRGSGRYRRGEPATGLSAWLKMYQGAEMPYLSGSVCP